MKSFYTFVVLVLLFNSVAFAQIQGAVSFNDPTADFKKDSVKQTSEIAETTVPEVAEKKDDPKQLLAKKMKATRHWDNPRFVKATYGNLKGMQESIDRQHQDALDEKKITDETERQKALKEMQESALVNFNDYTEESQVIHQKMNENPRESILDLTSRISYIDSKKMTDAHSEYVANKLEDNFMEHQGVSMADYQAAFVEQIKNQQETREEDALKANTFPPLNEQEALRVEKLDETKALIHVGVKAPQSKR